MDKDETGSITDGRSGRYDKIVYQGTSNFTSQYNNISILGGKNKTYIKYVVRQMFYYSVNAV